MEIIRKLTTNHPYLYRSIRLESLQNNPESFGTTFEEENKNFKLQFETDIEQKNKGRFIVGVFVNEHLIGICGFAQESETKTRHKGKIIQMYLKPEFHGQGIGLKLLATTIDEAFFIPEIEQITLEVATVNEHAVDLYKKVGFSEYGFQKNYFKYKDQYFDQKLVILYRKDYKK